MVLMHLGLKNDGPFVPHINS